MNQLTHEIANLEQSKEEVSKKVNSLVKSAGKAARQSNEFKELISAGNQLKAQINELLEQLIPLQEIVQIACLRLPNSLHVSSLLVHALQSNTDFRPHFSLCTSENEVLSEENSSIVVFRMNENKAKAHVVDWRQVLNSGSEAGEAGWSVVEEANHVLNNRYLTGEYARLELALVDYVHETLAHLNSLQMKGDYNFLCTSS